jgi:hypothetical protein
MQTTTTTPFAPNFWACKVVKEPAAQEGSNTNVRRKKEKSS